MKMYDLIPHDGRKSFYGKARVLETVVNAFRFYNCNHETGYYPAFYVREG